MEYIKYDCKTYNIHTINTNKFKTIRIEILFSSTCKEEDLPLYSILTDLMTDTSSSYPSRISMNIRKEELYKLVMYGVNSKVGNMMITSFICEFIDPVYIKDDPNYLEDVIKFIFDVILKPKTLNNEFDNKDLKVIKNRTIEDISLTMEDPNRKALLSALEYMDPESISSKRVLGTKELVESITTEKLYSAYIDLFSKFLCDIYIIGNVNNNIVDLIKKNYINRVIKTKNIPVYVNNLVRRKPQEVVEVDKFNQSTLVLIYNVLLENNKYNNSMIQLFNNILSSSGLNSILYQKIREEKSLCYSIRSMNLRYDGLLVIECNLDKSNVFRAKKIIIKSIKEIAKGNMISDDLFNMCKLGMKTSIESSMDVNVGILNNYFFHNVCNTPLYSESLDILKSIKKEDMISVAKALKLNTVYILNKGDNNE